jgi:hypothetical protein
MATEIRGTAAQATPAGRRNRRVAGAALVGIGLLVLAGKVVPAGARDLLFPPALAAIFLLWGGATRQVGLLIPGGILAGVGLGALVASGPLRGAGDEAAGGAFFLGLALGWAAITPLSARCTDRVHRWPLLVAGLLAAFGGALLAGEAARDRLAPLGRVLAAVLGFAGERWPLGLIAAGAYLLLRRAGAWG